MATFTVDRGLLNPKFEGYKFSALSQEEHVTAYSLSSRLTQATVSGRTKTPLSFEEVQSRITHNHLAVAEDGDVALYVDEEHKVVRLAIDAVRSKAGHYLSCELRDTGSRIRWNRRSAPFSSFRHPLIVRIRPLPCTKNTRLLYRLREMSG